LRSATRWVPAHMEQEKQYETLKDKRMSKFRAAKMR
jgi:hypothetical protein